MFECGVPRGCWRPTIAAHAVRVPVAMFLVAALSALAGPVAARPAPVGPKAPAAVPAAGMFLVARRDLPSPAFHRSVVLLVRHDAGGTLGVIINRRTRFRLHELLPELDRRRAAQHAVFIGGPVAPNVIVLLAHREPAGAGFVPVTGDIAFSAERAVLESQLARQKPAHELRLYAGHAGWAPGQLDAELARGDWRLAPADTGAVFGDAEHELWQRLIDRLDPPGIRVRRQEWRRFERTPLPWNEVTTCA